MKKQIEPLKSFPDYTGDVNNLAYHDKKAVVHFVDENFKPLTVTQTKIASCKEHTPYRNHIEYIPRAGDSIMIGTEKPSVYEVLKVVHLLPSVRSGVQKIFVVLK